MKHFVIKIHETSSSAPLDSLINKDIDMREENGVYLDKIVPLSGASVLLVYIKS